MRDFRMYFIFIFGVILMTNTIVSANFEIGQNYHGFELLEKKFVKEVNAKCLLFQHTQSGARLLKITSDDPNKTFSIAFKTIPESDAGTPHIMEHSVLNGSENFPVKSPFDVLAKGSLNTFLNAMTGSEFTIYPVASMNHKDYYNLMHVYLDAVFNPLIYKDPRIFKQEGWHYELVDEQNPVVYKGVVYNEMKGVFSNPAQELGYQIMKNLFPNNSYGYSSGGYPSQIPSLSYEDFIDYHRKYYHPSNSYIFLYGDADLDKELAFIHEHYLNNYDKSETDIVFSIQPSFDEMKTVTASYPVAEGTSIKDQTFLSLSYVCGLNTDQKLRYALDILSDVLINHESAPVRLALQNAGIGRDVSAFINPMKQMMFQIRVQNAEAEQKEQFEQIVHKTLADVVENGVDQTAVEGILNRLEFRKREGDDAQKGLTYNFNVLDGWFFADDPFLSLEWEQHLSELRRDISNGYLEQVIQTHLIENPHSLLLAMEPDTTIQQMIMTKEQNELQDYKSNLTRQEKEKLIAETKELIEYQQREDSPEALSTIPMLELSDIDPKTEWYDIKESTVNDVPLFYHNEFTNHVVYTRLYFDLRVLNDDMIPWASLLSDLLSDLSTEQYTYGELADQLNLHTGEFRAFLTTYLENNIDDNLIPKFVIKSKCLNTKVNETAELIAEILNHSIFDRERLATLLNRRQSQLESYVERNGFHIARTRLRSNYSKVGLFDELSKGLEYYEFITELVDDYNEQYESIVENLQTTAALLFNRNNISVSVTCSQEDYDGGRQLADIVVKSLADQPSQMHRWSLGKAPVNEGLLAASKVQYVLQGYDYKKLGYEWDGKMLVLGQILSRDWLNNQLRVIGGAYGGFSTILRDGTIYFASYRDPNLEETLKNYQGMIEYLKSFKADETTMTRYIIGTIARMDQPLTPSQIGDVAVRYYFEGRTREEKQQEREAVLSTTAEDIRTMSGFIEDVLSQSPYCVYGNEDKLKSNKELFDELRATTQ